MPKQPGGDWGSIPGSARIAGRSSQPEIESFSKKGSELTKNQNRAINDQSKAAKTYKTTDIAASDRAKAAAETRKENEMNRIEKAYKYGKTEGTVKGAVVGAAGSAAVIAAVAAAKKKGTQANHTVTEHDRKTGKAK
jgi:hypothetical protein